MTYSHNNQY